MAAKEGALRAANAQLAHVQDERDEYRARAGELEDSLARLSANQRRSEESPVTTRCAIAPECCHYA